MANKKNTYLNMRWALLIEEYGAACAVCAKTWDLEFAHLRPTGLQGKSRGKSRRLTDILNHRDHYQLLCREHHDELDGRPTRRWR